MIYLRSTLLIMQNANNNGVKVELSGIPKSNLALLGLDKLIFLSLNMGNPPLAIFNSALLVTFLLILGKKAMNIISVDSSNIDNEHICCASL
jgi:hypothetical protein